MRFGNFGHTVRCGLVTRATLRVGTAAWCVFGLAPMGLVAQEFDDEPFVLPTLIIDGTRIERDYLDVTESVGVLSGDAIEERGIDDLRDAFQTQGNVRLFEGNRGENGFVIRGLNSEGITESSNNAPLTSVIIDGVGQSVEATRRGARGLWDVDQVEIYRGPQSTLQGRGALAGAVIIETNSPTFEFEQKYRGIVGEGDRLDLAGVISGPITEQLAFRLSGETRSETNSIRFDIPENEEIGEDRFRQVRGKLLFEPVDLPQWSFELAVTDTFDRPAVNSVNGTDFFAREFSGGGSNAEIREADNLNVSLTSLYDLGENRELKFVTAFTDSRTNIRFPAGGTTERDEFRGGRDISQDVQYTFGDEEDVFSGVAGVFVGRFTLPRESFVAGASGGNVFVVQDLESNDRTTSIGVYGDVRYRFAPNWIAVAGGRYAYEKVTEDVTGVTSEIRAPDGTVITPGAPLDNQTSGSFNVFLPKIGAIYEVDDFNTVSFTRSEGYRSGFTELANGSVNEIDPEFLTSYELSWKSEDPSGAWRFGTSIFYSEYRDQQIVVAVPGGTPQTETAGESRLYGAEFEGSYSFDNGFDVFGSVGLLETEFTDFNLSSGDLSGNEFPEAPGLTASLGVNYKADSGFFAAATASFTEAYFSTGSIENDPALRVDSFTRVDAQAGYETETLRMAVYVDNVFDSDYVTSLFNNNFGEDPVEATVSEPRRIGFEITATF